MDGITLFGLISLSFMVIFYALEARGRGYILAFSGTCVLASLYGFLSGAWPFGVVEAIWAVIAFRRYQKMT